MLLLLREGFRVKVNAVALHGLIEEEICDFVAMTERLPIHMRFIEFMPFAGNHWQSKKSGYRCSDAGFGEGKVRNRQARR